MAEKCMVIGLGQIGMGYDLGHISEDTVYSHARAFSTHPAFELVCAVDPSETKRETFESRYKKPAFPDIYSAAQVLSASVVVIAVPTNQHSEVLEEVLLRLHPKVILCEKPLAYNLPRAAEMVAACERLGVKLFVNYMRRSDPGVVDIKRRIDAGSLPLPIKGVVWYSKGLLHNGSHFFNLLEFWLGSFVGAKVLDAGRLWDDRDPEPDVQVEFERGKMVFLAAWEEAFSHYTIELLCPKGRLRYEQGGASILWQTTTVDPDFANYEILAHSTESLPNGMSRYQWHVADQIASALADIPHNLCTGRQAMGTLDALHKIINQR
jgi:predicted dehydrogenase